MSGRAYHKVLRTRGFRFLRVQKPITKLLGIQYPRSTKSIEIDITYSCNLRCVNCDRSCRQAPSNERMTVEQIEKFIKESIDNEMQWKTVRVMGGEPTLHPNLLEILDLLLDYKKNDSPNTSIEFITNGFGKKVNSVLPNVPKEIKIENSSKQSQEQFFDPFNMAPKDSFRYKFADYRNGCYWPSVVGIGLTPYGYYPCAVAGAIDRIFGFDYGRKKLPPVDDPMLDQKRIFCSLCGHFRAAKRTNEEIMSPSWKLAYEKYKKKKPNISLY